jgi:hypothetical protein
MYGHPPMEEQNVLKSEISVYLLPFATGAIDVSFLGPNSLIMPP